MSRKLEKYLMKEFCLRYFFLKQFNAFPLAMLFLDQYRCYGTTDNGSCVSVLMIVEAEIMQFTCLCIDFITLRNKGYHEIY